MFLGWIEIIGYSGSVLVAVSLMMTSMKRLRWINLIGASTFATYGLLLGAYPVFALNGFITLVDVFYIFQMYRRKDYFELLEIKNPNTAILNRFLEYHFDDIKTYFPDIDFTQNKKPLIFFTLRNMLPVGLFIGDIEENNILEIKLDYVIKGYRDFKMAKYIFNKRTDIFHKHNICKIQIETTNPKHIKYIMKMRFKSDETIGANYYSRVIAEHDDKIEKTISKS